MCPGHLVGPFFTTSPVADEIEITRVDQDGDVLANEEGNIGGFVGEPVLHHV